MEKNSSNDSVTTLVASTSLRQNMAFIGAGTNKKISASAPSTYRSKFAEHHFDAQLIDFSDGKDQPDNYEEFIDRRLELIATRINEFLGVEAG